MNITLHSINLSIYKIGVMILIVMLLNVSCDNRDSEISRILLKDISNEIFKYNYPCNYLLEEKYPIVLKGQREKFVNNLMPIAPIKISNELYDKISNPFHYNRKWNSGDIKNTFIISKDKVDKINDLIYHKSRFFLDDQLQCDDFSFPVDSSNLQYNYTDRITGEIIYDTVAYYRIIKIPDNYYYIHFISSPIFSDDMEYAIVSFGRYENFEENGKTVICKKKDDVWEIIMIVNEWGLLYTTYNIK